MKDKKKTAEERFAGVRQDLDNGWFTRREICLRRGVSSATIWRISKGTQVKGGVW
jgi:DNA invertase Pin-like site-specific DNA recombinase